MTDLRSALQRYLTMRKGLGYKYEHQTWRLADFVVFMEKRKATIITTKLAMEWATLPPVRRASWAIRLADVRGFARHASSRRRDGFLFCSPTDVRTDGVWFGTTKSQSAPFRPISLLNTGIRFLPVGASTDCRAGCQAATRSTLDRR
jgi:hypothetical protein